MADIGRKGGEHSHGGSSQASSRGGSSEQHAEAGRQSHKNT
jgi:general stress protein YciG